MERFILHSDANSFYASVEMLLNPSLRGKAVAVCGSVENRHGIVLAKSELAKKAGVKTGQANWEARETCPGLIVVPPQYEQYCKFSALLRNIYLRYSNEVESFGMDECWIDITPICNSFLEAERIADEIRMAVKTELGITVSVGVSFNKIFAKLGSDMKKPDAITVLDDQNWREQVWPLAASEILYVGRATTRKLAKYGVNTIGDLAHTKPEILRSWFGKNGLGLWVFANGLDQSRVMPIDFHPDVKSVGHGITCSRDLHGEEEVWRVMLELSQDVGHRLRKYHLSARGVQLFVRDHEMGILTPGGKTHWRESTILSILSNEKYKGDALLQKTFTVDFLTKKHKQNEGEVPQYYVRGNHEAIIAPDEFEQVQAELARRKRASRAFSGNSVFASRLICGDCGGYYGQKVWHSNDPYRKVIWRCNRKYGKGQRCSTPTLSEDAIKALFVKAYNLLLGNRETIIEDAETLAAMLEDTAALDTKIAAAQEEIDTVVELNKALIREHAVTGVPQEEFDQKAAAYDERFRKADAKLNRLKAEKQDRLMRVCSVKKYVENLRGQAGPIDVWNEQAWCLLVTQVTVHADGSAEFLFRGENRIMVK